MSEPSVPGAQRRDRLLAMLSDLVARGGAAPLIMPPVAPGAAAFPEPWKPTKGGVQALLRRLAWHAGGLGERSVTIVDQRIGAPPTEHKPRSRCELAEVRAKELVFVLGYIGEDDIVGTLAHEISVAYAALHRPDEKDPYRSSEQQVIAIDPDRDLERGSLATVYVGLGVLAANAAFQQYTSRIAVDAYQPHVYEVHRAGYLDLSDLAFMLAVQAVIRGERTPPAGLGRPQRDEVIPWIAALADREHELRERLGVDHGAVRHGVDQCAAVTTRPRPQRFEDVDLRDEIAPTRRTAFRWSTHRGGVGMLLGLVTGVGLGFATGGSAGAFSSLAVGGVAAGSIIGRRSRQVRCSNCATIIGGGAASCRACGAAMRGDIARLADRLEAEERLDDEAHPGSAARHDEPRAMKSD